MSSEIAVKVHGLSKCYQIYDQPRDRLKQFILPPLQRVIGADQKQFFREFWALKDVSFEVKKGETVGIVGRNGSGKSTLLQMICGTLDSTSGSIQTNGRIAALLELGSGFNPEFTGRENVYLNGSLLGLSIPELDSKFDDIAAFADIGEFIDRPVKTYSSGMYVRLAFAVQAMVNPDVLIVDEALAVGDERFQRKCFARLERLKSEGAAILFVSHSSGSIIELCQKTLLLESGRRIMFGSPTDIIRIYQKLLYAPPSTQDRLIDDLLEEEVMTSGKDDQAVGTRVQTEGANDYLNKIENSALPNEESNDAFDSSLVPETTVVYPTQGAEIQSIYITNATGQVVNILQPGQTYFFNVTGCFLTDLSGVFFGVHIKTASGVVITGQRYPEEGCYLHNSTATNSFNVVFAFRMDLLPGAYFAGCGVWSRDEPNCAHRIIDAIMFRISYTEKRVAFGYVDMSCGEPKVQINSCES